MDEPMLRAWINEPHKPQPAIGNFGGYWVAETEWPSRRVETLILQLNLRSASPLGGEVDGALAGGWGVMSPPLPFSTEISPWQQYLPPGNAKPLPTSPSRGEALFEGEGLCLASPVTAGRDCGRWGGYGGDSPDLAVDQRREDGAGLTFDTAPLDGDLVLLGAPIVGLTATADCPALNLIARLCDVAPDGTSTLITWGVLNLTHRDSHEMPAPIVPGQPFAATIRLNDIGRRIAKGSRLRLSLATQHWPIIWPQPGRGGIQIAPGASRLTLPVHPGDATKLAFAPAERAPPVPAIEERPGRYQRRIVEDVGTGEQRIELFTDYGRTRLIPYDIATDSWCRETMTITRDDPLSARLDAEWKIGFVSDGVDAEVRSQVTLTADAEAFDLLWSVEASDGGEMFHQRTGQERFARDFI